MTTRIQDYAAIGDCRSAALISRHGSLDWLCWPRFDSPAVFAAILDPNAGKWSIAPTGPFRASRRYLEGTNILETRFETDATAQGLDGLKGHRSVGGMRASIYNAFPEEGVDTLIQFMREFERTRG